MNLMHSKSLNKKKLLRNNYVPKMPEQAGLPIWCRKTHPPPPPPPPNNYDDRADLFHMPDKKEF
jgi:hypothetical protein